MQNLLNDLKTLLSQDARFVSPGGLLKNKIIECALALDSNLLALLLTNDSIKKSFFTQVGEILVFDSSKFQRYVSNKDFLPDSYTSFKKGIGLTVNDKLISQCGEVVLSWQGKDCLLEGGQTKEDQKRSEIFWNETLSPDEIDRLLSPKVLTKFKLFTAEGEKKVTGFTRTAQFNKDRGLPIDTITDNLVVKGNNLIALHSLKKEFAGKVKLIYIDPPYYFTKVKPSDTFSYNSNFRLTTWLTFMKDRLKAAKELLMTNGVLLCHIGEDGFHWLKVLTSEIFFADNFVETFIWKNTDNPDSLSKKSRSSVEYIICFEKNKNTAIEYVGKETENGDAPLLNTGNNAHKLVFPVGSIRFNIPDGKYVRGIHDRVELLNDVIVSDGKNSNIVELVGEFKWNQKLLDEEITSGTYFLVKSKKFSIRFQRPEGTSMAPEKFIDDQYLSKAIGVGTNEDANTHLKKMGIDFPYSKPESVVAFFIRAVTKKDDIVCDFFIGSGTTAAVAHKMGRQYIAVDQMDYIEDTTVRRLNKVIKGEQGGISETVGWTGGGSFIYCELMKNNQKMIDTIQSADDASLNSLFAELSSNGSFKYYLNEGDSGGFASMPINLKRSLLIEAVDKNQLYVNLSDLNNEDYSISAEDKLLNKDFYAK